MPLIVQRGPYVAIAIAVVCVSFAAIFITWSESDPITIALYRLAFASLILLPIAVLHPSRPLRQVDRKGALVMSGVGALLATHFALWITSLKTEGVTVASSVILVTSHPLLVGLVSHFVLRERLNRMSALGIVLGFGGVLIIATAAYGVSTITLVGNLLAFFGGVMAGFYFLAGRRVRQRVPILGYALVVYASATAVLFVYALVLGQSLVPTGDVPRELILFLALAVIPQIGGHTLYNWSLRYVSASVISLSLVGEPIGSSLLAWVLLSQVPGPAVAFGGILALGGIYLTMMGETGRARQLAVTRDIE